MADKDLPDEDKALFREAMRTVKPLKTTPVHTYTPPKPAPVQRKKPLPPSLIQPIQLSNFIRTEISGQSTLSYKQSGLPDSRFKDLKQGKIPWEKRLDLHGKTIDQASTLLAEWIRKNWQQGYRSLLIIHGKGEKDGKPPVLKNHVNTWLPQFEEILAYHSALPKDGGTGAVYVLLKRFVG